MQEYVLSELDSGERLITERLTSVRSVSLGFWIGAGARDEPDAKAGVSHFIEHLLFKGTRSYDAQKIAEVFDEMGGELNAATSREHTVVYARVPDRHLEDALDVMADMVFSPTFAELDSEREVVLEEIAMVEDAPQDLVHDLFSEAVFHEHPLGRPVIGRAEVISSIGRRSVSAYHRGVVRGREHRPRRRGEPRARRRREPAGAVRPASGRAAGEADEGAHAARPRARAQHALPAQGHRAVPRLRRRARDRAQRPPPVRSLAARRDPRRVGVLAPLPGDPREARDGVLGLQLRVAVHGHGPRRDLRRDARGEPRGLPGDRRRRDRRHRCRQPARARAGAGEGEPEGADRALDGVDLEPDEPARPFADHRHRAALARPDHRRDRRGRARTRSPSWPACCSTRRGSRRRGSGRTRTAS